ncbi:hypothetical protein V1264_014880 [Littorina saxatilis]|uniref:Fucolectin tachylectin-4 pentraxin-1 domain-containing protein n=1 Tax=Littorina saxatilis TaxID=31220 RepID=A0AAN9GJG7_9CAEN
MAFSPIQKRSFQQNVSLADVIFTEDLVFDAGARSHLHCLKTCVTTPCCRAYTYTRQSSAVRGRVGCRGYSAVMTPHTASLSAPGARTFYRPLVQQTETKNVAVGKTAVQSSTYASQDTADKAVDNNTNTHYNAHSCAVTNPHSQGSWWQVDLGQSYDITRVVITNRGDCCGARLRDFDVNVYTENPMTTPAAMEMLCYHYCGSMTQGATEELHCDSGVVTGRYVRLTNAPNEYLQLCEVQVFALNDE